MCVWTGEPPCDACWLVWNLIEPVAGGALNQGDLRQIALPKCSNIQTVDGNRFFAHVLFAIWMNFDAST